MITNAPPLPPIDSWQVLELKLILFFENPNVSFGQDWWRELTGEEPESVRKRLERTDKGIFEGHHLVMAADALRTTWAVTPQTDYKTIAEAGLDSVPSAGPYPATRDWFSHLLVQWIEQHCPPIKRIAYAGKLFQKMDRREDSYLLLDRYLPSVQVDPETTEFQYRINRRRMSRTGIDGLEINRLNTWSSIRYEMRLNAGLPGGGLDAGLTVMNTVINGVLLAIDINTIDEFPGLLPRERVADIVRELIDCGTEIASSGDTP